MSGTSMACPAVTGMAARLLSADLSKNGLQAVMRQLPDSGRTASMLNLVSKAALQIFNDPKVEGDGMIR